jgi:diguanylate cyclase (GGDEF)-like protein
MLLRGVRSMTLTTRSLLLDDVAETTSIRDREDLDHAIARLLLQFLQAHSVTLFRLFEEGQVKHLVRRVVVSGSLENHGPATSADAAQTSSPATAAAWQECIARNGVVRCMGPDGRWLTLFPVEGEREVAGLLLVDSEEPLPSRDTDLVRGILRILKNHLALLDYGELDTLTGLLNRKTFESQFGKLCRRLTHVTEAAALEEPSWLALIDIDRFKSINDSHGHLFGDEVLLLVSQIMKRSFRGADQLFRFGGEEFVVVLDQASEAGALIALERLRGTIERHAFPQVGCVTVSAGYTRIQPQDGPTTCVERADAALYYAKNHGRNNVRCYEALAAAGELNVERRGGEIDLF